MGHWGGPLDTVGEAGGGGGPMNANLTSGAAMGYTCMFFPELILRSGKSFYCVFNSFKRLIFPNESKYECKEERLKK